MRTKIYLIFIFSFFISRNGFCQSDLISIKTDTSSFNYRLWDSVANAGNYSGYEKAIYIQHQKLLHANLPFEKFDTGGDTTKYVIPRKGIGGQSSINVVNGPCTNIDFESGLLTGWTPSWGFNPNATNPAYVPACCPTPGGSQVIVSGPGLDPYGGFPVVFPGGSFSLKLGDDLGGPNSNDNAHSDRVEQTFSVTAANANFTYRYAVVLQNPGHAVNEQPSFEIQMLAFPAGTPIPCTYYQVVASTTAVGFSTSSANSGVLYKPWTSVAVDLTPVIGQNVTIRFTTNDCSLGGHFGYAYIDGTCTNFATNVADTTCQNVPYVMCGPIGFASYQWDGPGVVSNTNACISVSTTGVYTCQTILVPGCPGPTFTHTLNTYPIPSITFTPSTNGNCSNQYTFAGTSTISAGTVPTYTYSFGDNGSGLGPNATHSYPPPGAGTYTVTLKATTSRGCKDSTKQVITIYPFPVIAFSPPSYCVNSLVQFTNTSAVPVVVGVPPGTVNTFTWNLGNGQSSNLQNPTSTYSTNGTYTITLGATSDQGCTTTSSQTLGIFPPPVLNFTANPLCDINGTGFTPFTSTAVASGSIISYFWRFGDGGTSTLQNPIHFYTAAGIYTITYKGTTNHFCVDSVSKTFSISPTPTVAFSTTSLNACAPQFTFTNNSTIPPPSSISYSWSFGGTNTSTLTSPSYSFPSVGNYTVQLIGTSNLGCADTALQVITIYPFPVVSVSLPVSCENNVITVTTTPLSGTISAFNWDFGDPLSGALNTSTLQSPAHTYSTVAIYTLSLAMVSAQGCPLSYTNTISVHPKPTPALNFFPADACTTTFSFVNNSGFSPPPPPGNTISSYSWNFGGVNTSTLTSPVYVFPGPGLYTVTLLASSNFSCQALDSKTLAIYPYPTASLSVLNSCLNIPAVFNGTFSLSQVPFPGTVPSYTWNFGDGNSDNTLSPTHSYTTFGTYPISFGVTSNQGCVRTVTANLTIHPLPTTLNFNFFNPCFGTPVTFSSNVLMPPGSSITGYKWDFDDDGSINSTAINPAYTYTAPGSYTVELRIVTNNNCIDSVRKPLTVYDVPTSVISTTNVCFKTGTPFSASSSSPGIGSIMSSYFWNFGNGQFGNSQAGIHNYTSAGTYTISLTTVNNNSCTNTSSGLVTVHQLPVADFNANPVCLGSLTSFTNISSIGVPDLILKYRWNFGTGWEDSVNFNPTKAFPASGNYSVKLEIQSNHQCNATQTKNIIVYGNPIANFANSTICVGDNITFYNLSSTSDGTISSNIWDFNGDGIVDYIGESPKFTYGINGSFTAKLEVKTNYGCTASKTKQLFANPKAVPVFTSDKKSGCPTLCVNFKSLSYITTGTFTSRWDFGDGGPGGTFTDMNHCFDAGSYGVSLKLTTDSGCVSSRIEPGFITVYSNPVAAFSVDPPEIDEDDPTINVYSDASSNTSFTKYFISDGTSYESKNFTHYIKNMGKKTKPMIVQIVRTPQGCADTVYKVLDIKPVYVLYVPNVFTPNDDGTNDFFVPKGVGILKFSMQIFDRWGHMVWDTNDFTTTWDGSEKGGTQPIKEDVYTWKAQVTDIFNKNHYLVGHVSVVR
ncbi:MAG: PKD domain-containing protein [bacterium]|nr:PKD domain-containing protein [bacterium]